MARWTAFAHAGEYAFDADRVARHWSRLHGADAEPLPDNAAVLQAWALCHQGRFEEAAQEGLAAGGNGLTVASKAMTLQATYLETCEKTRLDLLLEAAGQAHAQTQAQPDNPSAWYGHAAALGRYSQGISVAKALSQGLGGKVRQALEHAIALQPRHADAHVALGLFHAEVIDKVGALIGGMTYGAQRETGLQLLRQGLQLSRSPLTLLEAANGLLMLQGDAAREEAQALYEEAAACEPVDAIERLYVERARVELQD